jgi:hypothetical protein
VEAVLTGIHGIEGDLLLAKDALGVVTWDDVADRHLEIDHVTVGQRSLELHVEGHWLRCAFEAITLSSDDGQELAFPARSSKATLK